MKFIIDSSAKKPKAFKLAKDRDAVDQWERPHKEEEEQPAEESERSEGGESAIFPNIIDRLLIQNQIFNVSIPRVLSGISAMEMAQIQVRLREYVAKHSVQVEVADGYELYEIPVHLMGDLSRRLEDFYAFTRGKRLLPDFFLMGLVSSYDAFLSELLRTILTVRPEDVSLDEKPLTLKDLTGLGSVLAARQLLIDREVDKVMRDSHIEHIKWIEKHAGTKIIENNPLWPEYVELFERRNILTHTAGIVSSQYIDVCKNNGVDVTHIKVGTRKRIDIKYLNRSVNLLAEFGFKLSIVVWRKIVRNDAEITTKTLEATTYKLITQRRYKLAARLLKFALEEQKWTGDDASKKRMVVNYANATKLGGDMDAALKILDGTDWSATSAQFNICVMAVKDDIDGVVAMMNNTGGNDDLPRAEEFREWPVFEPMRSKPEFIDAFEMKFAEPFFNVVDKVASSEGGINIQAGTDETPLSGSANSPKDELGLFFEGVQR